MKVVIQRVSKASVTIDNQVVGQCGNGYMLLVGFCEGDNLNVVKKMANKIAYLRIFEDEAGKMNKSILDIKGEILSISQFTLYANCREGRRPSFIEALNPTEATKLYDLFNEELKTYDIKVETGRFQSTMSVSLINQGPVTIVLDSKELKNI